MYQHLYVVLFLPLSSDLIVYYDYCTYIMETDINYLYVNRHSHENWIVMWNEILEHLN